MSGIIVFGQLERNPDAYFSRLCVYTLKAALSLSSGVYESFDTLCIYLESDAATVAADLDRNYWVRYRIAVMNQKHPERTVWKESSICTRTWNNSVLQFMKVRRLLLRSCDRCSLQFCGIGPRETVVWGGQSGGQLP